MSSPTAPIAIRVNGQPREVSSELTVCSLLGELGLTGQRVAVMLNGEIVPRERFQGRRLRAGDDVELITLAGGG